MLSKRYRCCVCVVRVVGFVLSAAACWLVCPHVDGSPGRANARDRIRARFATNLCISTFFLARGRARVTSRKLLFQCARGAGISRATDYIYGRRIFWPYCVCVRVCVSDRMLCQCSSSTYAYTTCYAVDSLPPSTSSLYLQSYRLDHICSKPYSAVLWSLRCIIIMILVLMRSHTRTHTTQCMHIHIYAPRHVCGRNALTEIIPVRHAAGGQRNACLLFKLNH